MNKCICLVIFLVATSKLLSQTASQPLELPNFIIEGKEQIDIQIGTKQIPSYSTFLERSAIDSLVIIGKPRNYIIFPTKFPNSIVSKTFPDGFVIGKVGSFLSVAVDGGYRTNFKGYDIFTFGKIDASKGHVVNANYTKLHLGLQTDYLAPEKFYIFGGSKTTTNIDFDFKNYRLFALTDAPSRNQIGLFAKIASIGEFEGFDFQTGAKLSTVNQTGAGNSISENTLGGFLEVSTKSYSNPIGGRVSLDFRSFENNSTNFFELYGFTKLNVSDIIIEPHLGLQFAQSSTGKSRPMVLVSASATKQIHPNLTIYANISNKMSNLSFTDFVKQNPYLADSLTIDFGDKIEFQGKAKFQPIKDFALTFNATYSIHKRLPSFNVRKFGYFDILYPDANIFSATIEGFWSNATLGTISGNVTINSTTQSDNKKEVPNIPSLQMRFDYSRKVFEKIKLGASFEHIGKRFSDIENNYVLSSYNNLSLNADYFLNNLTIITLNIENLLNSNIVNWYGYKEWGFNFKVGIMYKF